MSDSEGEFDITKNLAFNEDSSEESGQEEFGYEDVQDEILSSEGEGEGEDEAVTKAKDSKTDKAFPRMELEDDDSKEDNIAGYFAAPQLTKKKSSGTFGGLGLSKILQTNIAKKGFKTPTPIQRKAIPFVLDGRDVVGMARTGSGKTAAFVLPMLERLKVHSAKVGARALILSPNRELAEQTLKVIKTFSRGSDLRTVLLMGGDSLQDQFGYMMSNPDIIVATPGRLLHLKVEMQLDLKSIEYVVFDEADRLFELGFADHLNEILASLSTSRQTLLFSATLPKSLVEFAKAGLQDPILVRLDAETKISENLEMAFFAIKDRERDAALGYLLQDVIKVPGATDEQKQYLNEKYIDSEDEDENEEESKNKKNNKKKHRLPKLPKANELVSEHSTIVFVPTKHHVEYIQFLLTKMGYAVSYIYGTLDQSARKQQLLRFRSGVTNILVVTDVAARGIDIPILANVINYSIPSNPKVFLHRVGRTARAGRRGWAYSLIQQHELPYLLDLEVFIGRKLLFGSKMNAKAAADTVNNPFTERLVLGGFPRDEVENVAEEIEHIISRDYDLKQQLSVADKGEKQYLKSRQAASAESAKRAKGVAQDGWDEQNLLFTKNNSQDEAKVGMEQAKQQLLEKLANRKGAKETVFEFKKTAQSKEVAQLMARRRKQLLPIQVRAEEKKKLKKSQQELEDARGHVSDEEMGNGTADLTSASERDIESVFQDADQVEEERRQQRKKRKRDFKDESFYMSHFTSAEAASERGYALNGDFVESARTATFDLDDEGRQQVAKQMIRWDSKKGKYVNSNGIDNVKYIRGEGGTKIPASFRTGKFDEWKAAHKAGNLVVGAMESTINNGAKSQSNRRFKHNKITAPKMADKARDDYGARKKKVATAMEKGLQVKGMRNNKAATTNGILDTEAVRKQRALKQKRRDKNARPMSKKKK
ncbi:ATP-dependent RNA helicase Dbp10p [Trichomonascus vanleenenianus]|uniref:ATP-dependent RNA helicase DBP10 n=1 Tax=Trichomonascus vanleenenianus TaxID=2268995 RepID=UPI003ECBAC2E